MDKMDPKYAPLFTPWKIGNVEIKNRIVLPPMLMGFGHFDGKPTENINALILKVIDVPILD